MVVPCRVNERNFCRFTIEAEAILWASFAQQEIRASSTANIVMMTAMKISRVAKNVKDRSECKGLVWSHDTFVCMLFLKQSLCCAGKPSYLMDDTNPDWAPSVRLGYTTNQTSVSEGRYVFSCAERSSSVQQCVLFAKVLRLRRQ